MEGLIQLILVCFGTILGSLFLWKVFDMVRSSINKNKDIPEEQFNRLARAFVEHKKEMTDRVQNLEAIVAQKTDSNSKKSFAEIEANKDEEHLTNELNKINSTEL